MGNEFSVCQFFPDGGYEYVRRWVSAEEAFEAFTHYTESAGARIGTTVRVIITDGGDCTNAMWEYGKGLVYPTADEIGEKLDAKPGMGDETAKEQGDDKLGKGSGSAEGK